MSRLARLAPAYRRHAASGQAVVTLDGRDHYLGTHGTKASKLEYDRLIGEWLANGRRLATGATGDTTVVELAAAFMTHARAYYRDPDGTTAREADNYANVLRPVSPLIRLYGRKSAADFGPLALKAIRENMIASGWCRSNINRQIARIRHVFKWGAENELVPASIFHGLTAVSGLRAGRSEAREAEPVRPVADVMVDQTLPCLPPTVAAMVRLQLVTGMRPGEVCAMSTGSIDRTGPVWTYRPAQHKTAHHGHAREVALGPQAQEVLRPYLKLDADAFIFSPSESEARRHEAAHEARLIDGTPLSCGNRPGTNVVGRPRRTPGDRYEPGAYARAIERACDDAFPAPAELQRLRVPAHGRKTQATRWETKQEWRARLGEDGWKRLQTWRHEHRWHPHQLRHTAATKLRKLYGIEAARLILGHKSAAMTEIYAEADASKAQEIMSKVG